MHRPFLSVEKLAFNVQALRGNLDYFIDSYDIIKPLFNTDLDETDVNKFLERRLFMQKMQRTYPALPALLTQHKEPDKENEITRSCQHQHMRKDNLTEACEKKTRIEEMNKFLKKEKENLEKKAGLGHRGQ